MNLIDQVTSLEISKKLKALGFKAESYFYSLKFIGNCNSSKKFNEKNKVRIYNKSEFLYMHIKDLSIYNFADINMDDIYDIGDYLSLEVIPYPDLEKINRYTASELLEALPTFIIKDHEIYNLEIRPTRDGFNIYYANRYVDDSDIKDTIEASEECNKNLANGLGQTLIYLIKNNLMEVPK